MSVTNIWSQKFNSRDYKSSSLFHFRARWTQSASHCFFEIQNNIMLRATTRSPKSHVPFRLLKWNTVYTVWHAAQTYKYRCSSWTQTHRYALWLFLFWSIYVKRIPAWDVQTFRYIQFPLQAGFPVVPFCLPIPRYMSLIIQCVSFEVHSSRKEEETWSPDPRGLRSLNRVNVALISRRPVNLYSPVHPLAQPSVLMDVTWPRPREIKWSGGKFLIQLDLTCVPSRSKLHYPYSLSSLTFAILLHILVYSLKMLLFFHFS
jgi:hypothetical protein